MFVHVFSCVGWCVHSIFTFTIFVDVIIIVVTELYLSSSSSSLILFINFFVANVFFSRYDLL